MSLDRKYEVSTSKYSIFPNRLGGYKVIVYGGKMAGKLQRLLKSYPEGTKFGLDEEPMFNFDVSQLDDVKKVLNIPL